MKREPIGEEHATAPKIVIVGGVAGGMSAAARARRLNEYASIVVFEKDRYVSFANCGLPYHISGEIDDRSALLIVTPKDLAQRLDLEVHTEHEVTGIDRSRKVVMVRNLKTGAQREESYDKLVLATGAYPLRPPLPGADHRRVFTLRNIPDMDDILGSVESGATNAIVIGGGYIGIEMAEALNHRGLKVDLVEQSDQLLPPLDFEMSRDIALHMESHGVRLFLDNGVQEFRDADSRVEVRLRQGETLVADMAILAVGVRPETTLAQSAGLEMGARGLRVDEHMRTSDADIYAVGDAVEVRDTITGEWTLIPLAGPANRQGRVAADNILGRASRYESTLGSAVIRAFDMTCGATGASEKTLKRAGIEYRKVYVHPNGHAAYYPGTHPMHLKILFAPGDGRLLGAQAVGFDGVDKRLDVLATAIKGGMTIFDLEDLELSYAPPYGSAKDPINMAGFVAGNMLRGDVEPWYAEQWPEVAQQGGVLLDVRTPSEFARWHIPGAVHIPINQLRGRVNELEKYRGRKIYAYCLSGFRSYLAARQLKQRGFDVFNLSGGAKTFMAYHPNPVASAKPGTPWVPYAEAKTTSPDVPVT